MGGLEKLNASNRYYFCQVFNEVNSQIHLLLRIHSFSLTENILHYRFFVLCAAQYITFFFPDLTINKVFHVNDHYY